jgi:hypothetical protein
MPTTSRRQFLISAGTFIALPLLPSLLPGTAFADDPPSSPAAPTRMLLMSHPLGYAPKSVFFSRYGFDNEGWHPADGLDPMKLPACHASLTPHRADISFVKGLHHRLFRADVHGAEDVTFTAADTMADPSRAFSNTVSVDQVAAESPHFTAGVRHRSQCLGVPPNGWDSSRSGGLSWTRQGIPIPPSTSPAQVFDQLFGADDLPRAARIARLQDQRSVLDATRSQVGDMARKLDAADRRKLDEVLTAIRDIEHEIQLEESWMDTPKPKAPCPRPDPTIDPSYSMRQTEAMLELIHAAFLTDSTRIITYHFPALFYDRLKTRSTGHDCAHARNPDDAKALIDNDTLVSDALASLLGRLEAAKEHDGKSVLHRTVGALTAGYWGVGHDMRNAPVMLFGHGDGRLKQGTVRSYPDTPLANAWLTLLAAAGCHVDSFGDSTGTLAELLS